MEIRSVDGEIVLVPFKRSTLTSANSRFENIYLVFTFRHTHHLLKLAHFIIIIIGVENIILNFRIVFTLVGIFA